MEATERMDAQLHSRCLRVIRIFSTSNSSSCCFPCTPQERIDKLCHDHLNVRAQYFVTEDKSSLAHRRRMTSGDVSCAVSKLKQTRLQSYICGPPPMIEEVEKMLNSCGVDPGRVFAEKWW